MTSIEWTEATWNPIAGCSVLSPGCTNCYAMRTAARLARIEATAPIYAGLTQPSKAGPVWTGRIAVNEKALLEPLRRRKPTMYFVNSMSDLFHEAVPDETIDRVFAVMALCPQHTFQVLTKRSARMREYVGRAGVAGNARFYPGHSIMTAMDGLSRDKWPDLRWPLPNVWLGVSVEDQKRADERIPDLLATPAAVRFLSCEPLLGPVDLRGHISEPWEGLASTWTDRDGILRGDLTGNAIDGIEWVIVGGESGPGARPMRDIWAQDIVNQCQDAGTAVFVKQLSSGGPKPIKDIDQFPEGLRVREWPNAR
jgi:protein gp37